MVTRFCQKINVTHPADTRTGLCTAHTDTCSALRASSNASLCFAIPQHRHGQAPPSHTSILQQRASDRAWLALYLVASHVSPPVCSPSACWSVTPACHFTGGRSGYETNTGETAAGAGVQALRLHGIQACGAWCSTLCVAICCSR